MNSTLQTATPLPRTTGWVDRVGTYASAACIVHCVATPVLLSMSVVAAQWLPTEAHTHRTLAVGLAGVGAIALVNGLRRHGRREVLWLMSAGLAAIFAGAFLPLRHHWQELAMTLTGSALLIAAHRLNHTFCHNCACTVPQDAQRCGSAPNQNS